MRVIDAGSRWRYEILAEKGRSAHSIGGNRTAKPEPGRVLVLIGVADAGLEPEDKIGVLYPDILIPSGRESKRRNEPS